MTHDVRCEPEQFEEILAGKSEVELREREPSYAIGDLLTIREFDQRPHAYTGRIAMRRITNIIAGMLGVQFAVIEPATHPNGRVVE